MLIFCLVKFFNPSSDLRFDKILIFHRENKVCIQIHLEKRHTGQPNMCRPLCHFDIADTDFPIMINPPYAVVMREKRSHWIGRNIGNNLTFEPARV